MDKAEVVFEKLSVSGGAIFRAIGNAVKRGKPMKKIMHQSEMMGEHATTMMRRGVSPGKGIAAQGKTYRKGMEQAGALDKASRKYKLGLTSEG